MSNIDGQEQLILRRVFIRVLGGRFPLQHFFYFLSEEGLEQFKKSERCQKLISNSVAGLEAETPKELGRSYYQFSINDPLHTFADKFAVMLRGSEIASNGSTCAGTCYTLPSLKEKAEAAIKAMNEKKWQSAMRRSDW